MIDKYINMLVTYLQRSYEELDQLDQEVGSINENKVSLKISHIMGKIVYVRMELNSLLSVLRHRAYKNGVPHERLDDTDYMHEDLQQEKPIIILFENKHFMETQCPYCGFQRIYIDHHTSQYNFCPQCGRRIVWGDNNGNAAADR